MTEPHVNMTPKIVIGLRAISGKMMMLFSPHRALRNLIKVVFAESGYWVFNKLENRKKYRKCMKILNTEHKCLTLYVINSAQNICIHYSVQYFTESE